MNKDIVVIRAITRKSFLSDFGNMTEAKFDLLCNLSGRSVWRFMGEDNMYNVGSTWSTDKGSALQRALNTVDGFGEFLIKWGYIEVQFTPVTITLTTQAQVDKLYGILQSGVLHNMVDGRGYIGCRNDLTKIYEQFADSAIMDNWSPIFKDLNEALRRGRENGK